MQTDEFAEQTASTAAQKWLAFVDSGDFEKSWHQSSLLFRDGVQTSALFKRGMSEQRWKSSVAALQTQLGKAESRSLRSKRYAEELPGAPNGEYVVLEYETSFGGQKNGVEKVTVMKEEDGEWRVSGYKVIAGHIPTSPWRPTPG